MTVAIPVEKDNGMQSPMYGHFGSAPYYFLFDTDTEKYRIIDNTGKEHEHGNCTPASELAESKTDFVICSGMGMRAIQKLNALGIKVLFGQGITDSAEALGKFKAGELREISLDEACGHHHGCH
ncbi:MAG: hypothetical protein A2Y33_16100 [Spirochaetes bacterium GWF1_51_8]|nr:MAG: hypothetical protein A2Y33_16100 [Spirochaetes bacterium GWF1_51_8]